jgi:hypothetical protein
LNREPWTKVITSSISPQTSAFVHRTMPALLHRK